MNSNQSSNGRAGRALAALIALAATATALAAPAGAATGQGTAAIVFAEHGKGRTLSGQGVKVLAGLPATKDGRTLSLPISAVDPGASASATGEGSLSFKRGKRSVSLTGLRFNLTAGTLSGKLGEEEVDVFELGAMAAVNPSSGSASLDGGKLRLTADAASELKQKLGLVRALRRDGVGMAWLAAKANPAHEAAKPIVSGSAGWGVLASWRKYVLGNFGPGSVGTITTAGGATASGTLSEAGAFFGFPATGGSYEKGLYGAADKLVLHTQGSVTFAKPGHCIVEVKLGDLELDDRRRQLLDRPRFGLRRRQTGRHELRRPAGCLDGGCDLRRSRPERDRSVLFRRRQDGHLEHHPSQSDRSGIDGLPGRQIPSGSAARSGHDHGGCRVSTARSIGGLATAAVFAAVAALPATAGAASGTTTLALNGPAAEVLHANGVRVAPLKPATGSSQRIALPVGAGLAGSGTTLLSHRGGISLRGKGGEELPLTKLSLVLGKRSRLTAKTGGKEIDFLRVLRGGRRDVDPASGSVTLARLRLKLTRAAAAAIAKQLGPPLDRKVMSDLTARPIGSISARARNLLGGGPTSTGATEGGGSAGASGCPLPSGAGPAPEQPLPVATRPAGAADIAGATIDWHVRESFIRYVGTGGGTSVSGGASADPPLLLPGTSAPLSYTFHFPFAAGWHDAGANPADPADDTAAIEFGGAIRFLYSGHEIDLTTADPEIEIAGARSRAIFAISESGGAAERQVLVNLDLSRAAAIAASGNRFTYERVPAAIPAGTASSVFAGFYAPGTEFGCVSVSFSTAS